MVADGSSAGALICTDQRRDLAGSAQGTVVIFTLNSPAEPMKKLDRLMAFQYRTQQL
jgi:hypothetical protein